MRRSMLRRLLTAAADDEDDEAALLAGMARRLASRAAADAFPKAAAVSSELTDLLTTRDRRHAERLARALTITQRELAALIINAGMLVAYCYLDAVLPETRRVLLQAAAEGLAKRADADRTVPLFGSIFRRALV